MEVTCPNCKTSLNIPDEKLPEDRTVRINCPKCKNKITIDPANSISPSNKRYDETGKMHLRYIESQKKESGGSAASDYDDYISDDSLDYYDDDVKLCLVMADASLSDKLRSAIETHGYKYISVSTTREALSKLRFHYFGLLILSDGFDGHEILGGPIMNYLNHLSMSSRRKIFLTLVSDRFKSMDDMMAYAMSANMVVNIKDLDKLSMLLKKGMLEYEKFYKVYMDTMVAEGKM